MLTRAKVFGLMIAALLAITLPALGVLGKTKALSTSSAPAMQTDDEALQIIGQIGGTSSAVAVQGDYAYLGVGPRVAVLNVSDPANPTMLGQTSVLLGLVQDVAVAGQYVYVGVERSVVYVEDYAHFWIFDASDPTNPTEAGSYDSPSCINCPTYGVAVSGQYAYLADGAEGLRIVDISDPTNVVQVGYYNPGWYEWFAKDVTIVDDIAYVITSSGLHIIDVSDPANPYQVGSYHTPGSPRGVAVADNVAYVADFYDLRIIDVSNPVMLSLHSF